MNTEQLPIGERLSAVQSQIWQTVSHTTSEAANQPITFGSTLVNEIQTADIYTELTSPRLIIQFAYSDLPEHAQVLLFPQELFTDIATLIRGSQPETLDDNLVAEIRQPLEAIVQGLCVAVSEISGTPTVASDLTIRFQIFSMPPNLQRAEKLIRTDIAVAADGLNNSVMWLMDAETAFHTVGASYAEEFSEDEYGHASEKSTDILQPQEEHGMEILLDIPLEISVELGRVRMRVKDIVELGSGSIVEIDKAAGEPVDVMVNGRLVARGEVVVIEDNFGVRITEILSPQERLQKLNEVA